MQLEILPRNYNPSTRVRTTVEERANKLLKYADLDRVKCTLTAEHVEMICELHLHAHGKDFHAKASSEDMLNAVDKATATMEKQLRRYKSRRDDARKALGEATGQKTSAAALEASIQTGDEADVEES